MNPLKWWAERKARIEKKNMEQDLFIMNHIMDYLWNKAGDERKSRIRDYITESYMYLRYACGEHHAVSFVSRFIVMKEEGRTLGEKSQ